MMKNVLAAAVTSAALMIASGALADGGPAPEPPPPPPEPVYQPPPPPEYNWYTTVFAGVAFSGDLDSDVTLFDPIDPAFDETFGISTPLNTGYLLGWTIGYAPQELFGSSWFTIRPEVELSFRQRDVDFEEIFFPDDEIIDDFFDGDPFNNLSDPADVLSLLFNGWLDFQLFGISTYVGGGIGVGWSDMPTTGGAFIPVDGIVLPVGGLVLPHFESTDFVWQAGGGFNFDLSDRVFIGVGYRFFSGGFDKDFSFFVEDVIDEQPVLIELPFNFDFDYDTHQVLFNLGVRF